MRKRSEKNLRPLQKIIHTEEVNKCPKICFVMQERGHRCCILSLINITFTSYYYEYNLTSVTLHWAKRGKFSENDQKKTNPFLPKLQPCTLSLFTCWELLFTHILVDDEFSLSLGWQENCLPCSTKGMWVTRIKASLKNCSIATASMPPCVIWGKQPCFDGNLTHGAIHFERVDQWLAELKSFVFLGPTHFCAMWILFLVGHILD